MANPSYTKSLSASGTLGVGGTTISYVENAGTAEEETKVIDISRCLAPFIGEDIILSVYVRTVPDFEQQNNG